MVKKNTTSNMQQQHLARKFFAESGKRTMVIGHRGGYFGPENSMKTFQAAMDNNLEGIEFDVISIRDFKRRMMNIDVCRSG